jgi:hypothetical protein
MQAISILNPEIDLNTQKYFTKKITYRFILA